MNGVGWWAGDHWRDRMQGSHVRIKRLLAAILSLEKAMAPHSSTSAWKIPWMEEPGGLQSMGSLRVGYDWATSLSLFAFMHWRRKWQPAPVFLPWESQGQGSLVGQESMGSHRVGHDWSDLATAAASYPSTSEKIRQCLQTSWAIESSFLIFLLMKPVSQFCNFWE